MRWTKEKNGCQIQLIDANINCSMWCGCSVLQFSGHSASVSVAFIFSTVLTGWMCSVSAGEGTFSPWNAGRKADSSRFILSPFWNKPQCILSAMRCIALNVFDIEQFIAAAHLWSCVWHKYWASFVLQLSGCPLGENPVLKLCSLLCPSTTCKTYFLFFFFSLGAKAPLLSLQHSYSCNDL